MSKLSDCIAMLTADEKPAVRYIDRAAVDAMKNDDVLSLNATVFRNGGRVAGMEAIAFVQLTPKLIELLRAVYEFQEQGAQGGDDK